MTQLVFIAKCGHVQVKPARVPVVGVVKLGEQPNVENHKGGEVKFRWLKFCYFFILGENGVALSCPFSP